MKRQSIIILKKGDSYQAWGSLKELCKENNISYWTVIRLKFPFEHDGYQFIKVPFRST